jgi:cytidylate kinase
LARWAYGYDPERLDAYDLVVNTCRRSPEVVTHMIAKAAEACTDLRIVSG